MKIVISAAGTAGHINPALAIAKKIQTECEKNNEEIQIIFIGTKKGLENDLIPRAGYELKHIEAYGLYKDISFTNLKNIFTTLFISPNKVKKIFKEFKPDLVIGTGGYICVPVMKAAKKMHIPFILHESNAFPGKAIKIFNKDASKILVGFEKAKDSFEYKDNIVYTGNPINISKKEFSNNEKKDILNKINEEYGTKLDINKKTLLAFGGSQGAKRINDNLIKLSNSNFLEENNFQLIWSVGKLNYEEIKKHVQKENVAVIPYIYNMEEIMNITDLIIARSGAMTISEISELEKRAVFIPLPSFGANRQIDNAKVLQEKNMAEIILNDELNEENLKENILKELNKTIENIEVKNNKKAIDLIYDEILKIINK